MLLSDLDRPGIDFFDVDHTIVDSSTSLQFLWTGIRLGHFSPTTFLSVPLFLWQYYLSELDMNKVQRAMRGFGGFTDEELVHLGNLNFEHNIRPRIFDESELLFKSLKEQGRKLCFVTSSFFHAIQPLADHLQVNYVLANRMKYKDGRTSGEFQEPFLFGNEKKHQALSLIKQLHYSPEQCSFYTDSINDLALLEVIGTPVVVNPDKKLKRRATERGWKILSFRKK